jgi:dihydrofolate synthase/folylpolyglutamate synthase
LIDRSVSPRGVDDGPLGDLLGWLDEHTNFEQVPAGGSVRLPTLVRIEALCDLLGEPQHAYRVVHITGTNGKGSTARILSSILASHGLHVGTYTSPNLHAVNERLAHHGRPIDDSSLTEVLGTLRQVEPLLAERPTRFELLTAAAFAWFADVAVDVAVVEVGLGGRWDATNVVRPDVTVVTNVSYDHVDVLGPTLRHIATEKAGIVKAGAPLVLGETAPDLVEVFADAARRVEVPVLRRGDAYDVCDNRVAVGGRLVGVQTPRQRYEELFLPLHGAHQAQNLAAAVVAAEEFFDRPLDRALLDEALATVSVPGRLEVMGRQPLVLVDGAHNVAGMSTLAAALRDELVVAGRRVAVIGMLGGRDPRAMLEALAAAQVTSVVACTAPSPRALPAGDVAAAARAVGLEVEVVDPVEAAVDRARAAVDDDGLVVVAGSLYVVAAARLHLFDTASEAAG